VCDIGDFTLSLQWKKSNKIIFNMDKSIKQAKLHGKSRLNANRQNRDVPWLNVNGLWLERAGFGVGQVIEIEVSDRRLIIKAL